MEVSAPNCPKNPCLIQFQINHNFSAACCLAAVPASEAAHARSAELLICIAVLLMLLVPACVLIGELAVAVLICGATAHEVQVRQYDIGIAMQTHRT